MGLQTLHSLHIKHIPNRFDMKQTAFAFNEALIAALIAVLIAALIAVPVSVLAEGDHVYGEGRRLAQSRDPCWPVRARTEGRDGV